MKLPPLAPEIQGTVDEAASVWRETDRLAVACHIGPDGDALGSILAVALSLTQLGKEVVCGWGSDPVVVPAQYAFLPGTDLIRPPSSFEGFEVFAAVDCASADRLDKLLDRYNAASIRLNVDHHVSNTRFGTIDVVDPDAPSSSELVLRILEAAGAPIDGDVATCLYTGLLTDTGSFQYASVTSRAHAAAGDLIDLGVKVDVVAQAVYESLPYGYLKTLGLVLERCELTSDPELVATYLTQEDLAGAGITFDETEGFIDVVRSIRESDVAAIFKQLADGRWKVSLRSKGATDVGAIARHFGGGGHRLAAGFELGPELRESIEAVRRALRETRVPDA